METTGRDYVREKVRNRDKQSCRICGKKWIGGRKFDVHHLNGLCGKMSRGYDSIKNISGLITLCRKCHCNIHSKGKKAHRGIDVDKARKMRSTGMTYDAIAKKLGFTARAVHARLNK